MQSKTSYLANLTPLRGIAALLTVIFHVDLMIGGGGDMLLKFKDSMLINKCYLMVDFFFVLSGFIMCHVYGGWFQNRVTGADFKRFTIARFARVYPLHVFTLAFIVAARLIFLGAGDVDSSPFAAASYTWSSIPTNLLLIQSMNVHNWFTWNNAAWSISTEWWMYMLFPFLVVPFVRLPSWGRIAVVLGCFAGYLSIMFYFLPLVTLPDSLSFIKNAGGFTSQPTINVAYQFGFLRLLRFCDRHGHVPGLPFGVCQTMAGFRLRAGAFCGGSGSLSAFCRPGRVYRRLLPPDPVVRRLRQPGHERPFRRPTLAAPRRLVVLHLPGTSADPIHHRFCDGLFEPARFPRRVGRSAAEAGYVDGVGHLSGFHCLHAVCFFSDL